MGTLNVELQRFEVVKKNEIGQDEPYLWVFGILVDSPTLQSQDFVIKKAESQGNLGEDFKKGESRRIPAAVGTINRNVTPIQFGGEGLLLAGLIVAAWEEDNTPNDQVKKAYSDTANIICDFIEERIQAMNTSRPTKEEISQLKSDIEDAVEKRFKSAIHWYNPFSWDFDDFIGVRRLFPDIDSSSAIDRAIDFTFSGAGAEYKVTGRFRYTP